MNRRSSMNKPHEKSYYLKVTFLTQTQLKGQIFLSISSILES
jgi:hypothetical protein